MAVLCILRQYESYERTSTVWLQIFYYRKFDSVIAKKNTHQLIYYCLILLTLTTEATESTASLCSYSVVELAEENQKFWNSISSIDLSYTFVDDDWNEETQTHHPFSTKVHWIVDRKSTKEREWLEETPNEDGKIKKRERYYDGTNTYEYHGYDLEKKYKSAREYYLYNDEVKRFGQLHERLNSFNIERLLLNSSYRDCFFNKPYLYFIIKDMSDSNLTFIEIMKKYPTSSPTRQIDSSGDVLWTFYFFPDERAASIFPEEFKEGLAHKEVVINETKNFLVQLIRSVSYYPLKKGGT